MGTRTMALALALTGCFSKPARPDDACGDAKLDPEETCDDGNVDDNDGCSERCQIAPWFECPTLGEVCHPVLALQWTTPTTTLPPLGNGGGVAFDHDCGTLTGINGPNTVIVGLQGEIEADAMDSIFGLRALCADVTVVADGSIRWGIPATTPAEGGSGAGGLGLEDRMCDPDEVVTGFDGNSSETQASGIELICQAITHEGGKLRFGTPNKLAVLGPANQVQQPSASCAAGEVSRAVVGRSGAIIDQFTLRCAATELAVCGDARVSEFETCDDGNAVPGDGCNEICSGD